MKYLSLVFLLLGLAVSAQDDQCVVLGDFRVADDLEARSASMPVDWKEINADLDPFYQEEQLPTIKTEGMPRL